jgi:hypothetical protein
MPDNESVPGAPAAKGFASIKTLASDISADLQALAQAPVPPRAAPPGPVSVYATDCFSCGEQVVSKSRFCPRCFGLLSKKAAAVTPAAPVTAASAPAARPRAPSAPRRSPRMSATAVLVAVWGVALGCFYLGVF